MSRPIQFCSNVEKKSVSKALMEARFAGGSNANVLSGYKATKAASAAASPSAYAASYTSTATFISSVPPDIPYCDPVPNCPYASSKVSNFRCPIFLSNSDWPVFVEKLNFVFPPLPRFVLIIITPLEAFAP